MMSALTSWSVQARNLPEHASNPIHTDEGARAAGFSAALVAGVTVYAYLTHPPVEAWGVDWVRRGAASVEFKSPVLAGDDVHCVPVETDDGWDVQAQVNGEMRARARVWASPPHRVRPERTLDIPLAVTTVVLSGEWDGYGMRAGDDLPLYDDLGIVHPAVWPALANRVTSKHLVRGSWIHTRSHIVHHAAAAVGATATIEPVLVDRFVTRAGHRAVLDISIRVDDRLVATIEHEAVVEII